MNEDTQRKIIVAWLIVGVPVLIILVVYWFYVNVVTKWIVAGVILTILCGLLTP
jgi:hypothetical protein